MRQDPEFFGETELTLLYIAKRLKEALKLEEHLTEAGINYAVETDTYRGGIIFASERVGAFFYVFEEDLVRAREVLIGISMKPYES